MAAAGKTLAVLLCFALPWPVWHGVRWSLQSGPAPTDGQLAMGGLPAADIRLADGMVRLPGGEFRMGRPRPSADHQRPVHAVRLAPFWLDAAPVTNRQFEAFVAETGYQTTAERDGASLVYHRARATWRRTEGADWRSPEGPGSSIAGREDFPVVQVSWHDAVAYARWAGKRLPTEAEYEYAARSGLDSRAFPWGDEHQPAGRYLANTSQGWLSQDDPAGDGYRGASPVDAFPPSRYGLYDIAGNVLCWCHDWYADDYYGRVAGPNPAGPATGQRRVRRGASWISSPHQPDALRVDARSSADPRAATNHTGFRCARDDRPGRRF